MVEPMMLQLGDTKRLLPKRDVRNSEGRFIKTAQRVFLLTPRSGVYTATLKDDKKNVIEVIEIDSQEGKGVAVEMRLQVWPREQE